MADDIFFKAFKENMELMGLPCPESIFGTLSTATATIAAMANGVKTLKGTATVAEVFRTIPWGAEAAGIATAVAEVTYIVGAASASFYLGACIGSLLVASTKTYGPHAYSKISGAMAKVAKDLNTSIAHLLDCALRAHPMMAPVRSTAVMARSLSR